jgi:molybdenum cofactor synthesis domain-containing protein
MGGNAGEKQNNHKFTACVLTVSDACSRGEREDASGEKAESLLTNMGFQVREKLIVPDEVNAIARQLRLWVGNCDLIITTGGTGLAPRDVTPEATKLVIERDAPGIAEYLRWTGFAATPRASLSRGIAGIAAATLIINLPGSPKAVEQGLHSMEPILAHAVSISRSLPVDH